MNQNRLPLLHAHRPVADLVEAFIADKAQADWCPQTVVNRRADLRNLAKAARGGTCADLDQDVLQRAIDYPSTRKRSSFVQDRIEEVLAWGVRKRWLSAEVVPMLAATTYTAPADYRDAPTRRKAAKQFGAEGDLYHGRDVPSHADVAEWAEAAGRFSPHGGGFVQVAAHGGPRFGELAVLTACPKVAAAGLGNLVAPNGKTVKVSRQLADDHTTKLPKADVVRTLRIHRQEHIPTGYDLQGWLIERSAEALAEKTAGTNPLALLFPGHAGRYMDYDRYYKKLFLPAMLELGWPHFDIVGKYGKVRRQWRFPTHSLRRRWVVTAIDDWDYPLKRLMETGGWLDSMTPFRWYYGVSGDADEAFYDELS